MTPGSYGLASRACAGSFRNTMLALAALGLVFAALPVLVIVAMSFSGGTTLDFPPQSISLRWYEAAFRTLGSGDGDAGGSGALGALQASLAIGLITIILSVTACLPLAYVLVRRGGAWRLWIEQLFGLPLVLPLVVLGLAYLLMAETLARDTGVELGLWRLALPHVTLALPFVLRNVMSAMHGIGPELEEAAQTLGASPWRAAVHVVLPLLKPGVIAGAIFAFIVSFNEFTLSFFLYTVDTSTLPIWMFSRTVSSLDPTTLAVATLIILLDVVLIACVDRFVARQGRPF
jgi:putative spermidine/putrescine transport system permease protein